MEVETTSSPAVGAGADTVVLGIFEGEELPGEVPEELLSAGEARAEWRRLAVGHDGGRRFVVVGLGERQRFDPDRARIAAATVHGRARELWAKSLCWVLPPGLTATDVAALVEGTLLHAYQFDRYKPAPRNDRVDRLLISGPPELTGSVASTAIVLAAQNRARDLGNTPANEMTPLALAEYAARVAERHPAVSFQVLDGRGIREAGMGAFAAVARGAASEPQLIRLEYSGGSGTPLLGLVGKAVTFDSGGLSLKPAGSMHEMKFDMAGGAAVIEAIAALAELRVPARVLGVVGATENLPSGTSVHPGDIVRALNGTTIEVNNTDAEGRLVLADCLCYAQRQGVDRLLDIATLTGGIITALGSTYAGLFSNDDKWAELIAACAASSGELVWRQPLHPDYARMVEGRYAQLTNRSERREASPITGAEFLHHFAGAKPWAHIDIAGTAYDVPKPYFVGKGATGFGVRLLVDVAQRLVSAR